MHELTNIKDKTVHSTQTSLVLYFLDWGHLRPSVLLSRACLSHLVNHIVRVGGRYGKCIYIYIHTVYLYTHIEVLYIYIL